MLTRIAVAIDSVGLRKRVIGAMRSRATLVSVLKNKSPLGVLGKEPCDVLIVSENRFIESTEDSLKIISDLPEAPAVIILTEDDDEERRVHLLASGCDAVLYGGISEQALTEAIRSIADKRREVQAEALRKNRLSAEPRLSDFVSNSQSMQAFMNLAKRVVRSDSSLLILGETGVGKERLALAIHGEGNRSSEPFIPINCAALPDNLLESELFGHEQGAFTGATRTRRGAFELAHGGTIFLDEIGDMPLALQSKLLRVLQDRKFVKLGGEKPISVDVRVMAATNRNLAEEIAAKRFRSDLYYRLSVVSLMIPPLRERKEDITELVHSYIEYLSPRIGVDVYDIEEGAKQALIEYDWPGNVRELINVLERAMLLCDGSKITLLDLPEEIAGAGGRGIVSNMLDEEYGLLDEMLDRPWRDVKKDIVGRFECQYLDGILQRNNGHIAQTAAAAGMTTRALYEKMQAYGLAKEDYR